MLSGEDGLFELVWLVVEVVYCFTHNTRTYSTNILKDLFINTLEMRFPLNYISIKDTLSYNLPSLW